MAAACGRVRPADRLGDRLGPADRARAGRVRFAAWEDSEGVILKVLPGPKTPLAAAPPAPGAPVAAAAAPAAAAARAAQAAQAQAAPINPTVPEQPTSRAARRAARGAA